MTQPHPTGGRSALAAGAAAAALVLLLWPLAHPALPLLPTDDLYTHLSVARHLARGEGFHCDIAYPLSFAWPFARELPQPLVHRPPAWPVVLMLPYRAAAGDPTRTVDLVRRLQVALLALVAGLGAAAWARRGQAGAATAWLVLLAACPLLPFAVDWGHTELPAGLLLLYAWLRHREGPRPLGARDGAVAGLLALLRPELAWLPAAWWATWAAWAAGAGPDGQERTRRAVATAQGRSGRRGALLALAVFLVLTAPWAARNVRLSGDPFFSVQAAAELAKDTRAWPGYEVYRQLEPQPPARALRDYPEAVARKAARGLRFYGREFPALLPWAAPLLLAGGVAAGLRAGRGSRRAALAPALALLTTAALAGLYSPLDHSLRHLVAVVPVLAWEAAPFVGSWPLALLGRRGARWRRRAAPTAAAALVLAVGLALLTALEPTGWGGAARQAAALREATLAEAAALRTLPPGEVAFVQTSAAPWLADRAAVWSPLDESTAARIRSWLAPAAGPKEAP